MSNTLEAKSPKHRSMYRMAQGQKSQKSRNRLSPDNQVFAKSARCSPIRNGHFVSHWCSQAELARKEVTTKLQLSSPGIPVIVLFDDQLFQISRSMRLFIGFYLLTSVEGQINSTVKRYYSE